MDYTEKVLEYFRNPKNMGRIENPDGVGKVGNPICGDVMWIYIKVGKNENGEDIIEDIKFETFGCAAAIATSSVVTELAKGKTLKEAEKISNKDVVEFLGGLPPIKKHCSLLAEEGLQSAINDYRSKKNERNR
ncbi:MAG: iron-sulfur cluster assembly scaffold protein [Candidatus Omnitrophica bacterium]|nr:iron-sulfur cluster assembly scaffold protein [Candidatus Omnitrophota bacterium]